MIIRNVKMFTEDRCFTDGEIRIFRGQFSEIMPSDPDPDIVDGQGAYAIPGLIDIHLHGCMGYDFSDGTSEAISEIAAYEARAGVTAIMPAAMTLPAEDLLRILKTAARYRRKNTSDPFRADLIGINMEGPFISKAKKVLRIRHISARVIRNYAGNFLRHPKGWSDLLASRRRRTGMRKTSYER